MSASALSGAARVAGVMGWPVSHSRSPRIHGHWLKRYGIDGAYVPLAVRPDRLGTAVEGLVALGFRGANVTVPHKTKVGAYCEWLDPSATAIGAVNTLVIADDGQMTGLNTDATGFIENLRANSNWAAGTAPAVVLGAGGAARAVVWALVEAGVATVRVVNRTRERADELAVAFGPAVECVAWEERAGALADAGLLVNTTVLGMTGQAVLDLCLDDLPPAAVVNDIVYAPLETVLLAHARARGNPVVDGLGMLLHQARPGFASWFGLDPVVDDMLRRVVLEDG